MLGWPNSSFRFFDKTTQKNPNELFGQPNSSLVYIITSLPKSSVEVCCLRLREVEHLSYGLLADVVALNRSSETVSSPPQITLPLTGAVVCTLLQNQVLGRELGRPSVGTQRTKVLVPCSALPEQTWRKAQGQAGFLRGTSKKEIRL